MGETALTPHVLLEGRRSRASAVHLAIVQTGYEQIFSELQNLGLEHLRVLGPRERPGHLTRGIAYVCTHGVVALVQIEVQRLLEDGQHLREAVWQKQAATAQFGQSEAAAVPGVLGFGGGEQLDQRGHHIVGHFEVQSARDPADTLRGRPPDHCVLVAQAGYEEIDDIFELLYIHIAEIVYLLLLDFVAD